MMKNDKRAISGVVMSVIMIVLVLVAVGVVWVVVQNLLESNAENIESSSDCLGLSFEVTDLECSDESGCSYTIERTLSSSSDPLGGMEVRYYDAEGTMRGPFAKGGDYLGKTTKTESSITDIERLVIKPYFGTYDGDDYNLCNLVFEYPEN